jgi:hypothetical protein
MVYVKNCLNCGVEFSTKYNFMVFCRKRCKQYFHNIQRIRKPYELKTCRYCGVEFRTNRISHFFCSKRCGNNYHANTPRGRAKAKELFHKYSHSKSGSELIAAKNRRRRALRNGAKGSHTRKRFIELVEMLGYMCPCCFRTFDLKELEEDHIVPLIKGGSDYIENIQPLCEPCNRKKHVKVVNYIEVFMTNTPDEGVLV